MIYVVLKKVETIYFLYCDIICCTLVSLFSFEFVYFEKKKILFCRIENPLKMALTIIEITIFRVKLKTQSLG